MAPFTMVENSIPSIRSDGALILILRFRMDFGPSDFAVSNDLVSNDLVSNDCVSTVSTSSLCCTS